MQMTLRTGTVIAALMVGTGVVFGEEVPVYDKSVEAVLNKISAATGDKGEKANTSTLGGKLQKQIEYSSGSDAKAYSGQQLTADSNGWKYLDKAKFTDVMNNGVTDCGKIKTDLQNLATKETAKEALERTAKQVAMNRALADMVYENAQKRVDSLNKLTKKIDEAGDPKEKEELQLRIAAEQMMLANEQTKIMALDLEQKAMVAIDEQMKKEIVDKKLSEGSYWSLPTGTSTATGTGSSGTVSVDCS